MIWKTMKTTYDRKTDTTIVEVTKGNKTVKLTAKGNLLSLEYDFNMRQLQRKAIEELKREKA